MKIKIDENLPARIADILAQHGHDADTVPQEGLEGRKDHDVWTSAQEQGRFLLTQDLDFSDVRKYEPGTHHGLLLLRLRLPGRQALIERVKQILADHDFHGWTGYLVIVTDHKIRVRSPHGASES